MTCERYQCGGSQRFLGSVQVKRPIDVAQRDYDVSTSQCVFGLLTAFSSFALDGKDFIQPGPASVAVRARLVRGAASRAVRHHLLDEEQDLGQFPRQLIRLFMISSPCGALQ